MELCAFVLTCFESTARLDGAETFFRDGRCAFGEVTPLKALLTFVFVAVCMAGNNCCAQQPDSGTWAEILANHYLVYPDQQYGFAGNVALKLDVWQNQDSKSPLPTVMYIHGGGWFFGDRTGAMPQLLPYLQKGWNAVNVEYRMSGQALAPAAVEDVRCALRWVNRNAEKFHFDTNRVIVTGHSAGGHLALMAGMLRAEDGFDHNCPAEEAWGEKPLKVAAIVNWYGISDVADLLDGPDRRTYAIEWLGAQQNREEIAKRVSPLSYVRAGVPPIITIHGDADPTVPYSNAVRLHEALSKIGAVNQLITVPGGKHGFQAFDDAHTKDAYEKIFAFLYQHVPDLGKK
jgi:acetyl esterase/lipase